VRRWASDWRWLTLAMVAGFLLIAYVVLKLTPDWFAETEDSAARQGVRTASLALLAGAIGVIGAVYTARTFALNRKGQITERFTRAVDQLASENLALRLGGIYALERIADESNTEYKPIIWILAAYVRENSPWPPPERSRDDRPPEAAEDIKAIVAVLRRRDVVRHELQDPIQIGLAHTNLRGSRAAEIHLIGADLSGAQLQRTDLRDARLGRANCPGANLGSANLSGADLSGANLLGANLTEADLSDANLMDATLTGAMLIGTHYSRETTWPEGFDPEAAGARPWKVVVGENPEPRA
jgi:Pentapeptide repeats (8 copies)